MFLLRAPGRLDSNYGLSPNSLDNAPAQALGATLHNLVFLSPALRRLPRIGGDELELQAGTPRVKYQDVHLHYNQRPPQALGRLEYLVRPLPAGNIGPIGTVLERVVLTGDLVIVKFRQGRTANPLQSWDVLNRIHSQREAIDLILDRQFQRSIDVAMFLITVDVEIGMVRATVGQAVDEPRVSVEIENDWFIRGEEQIEIR